jgi:HEAT repeat protein
MFQILALLALLGGQDDKAAEEAIDRFNKAYATTSEPDRAAAVAELTKTPHLKTLNKVNPVLTADQGPTVRIAAAKGLAAYTDLKKFASEALIKALNPNSKYPDVQVAIFESLGKLDEDSSLLTIHRYFVDEKDPKLIKAAIGAAQAIRNAASIQPLIDLAKKMEKFAKLKDDGSIDLPNAPPGYNIPSGEDQNRKRAIEVLPVAIKALQEITREKYTASKDWQTWWNDKRATFKVEK